MERNGVCLYGVQENSAERERDRWTRKIDENLYSIHDAFKYSLLCVCVFAHIYNLDCYRVMRYCCS